MHPRRLIVCFDGTWNTPDNGSNPTNVVKLLRSIKSRDGDVSQIVFYDKGVGTGGFTDRIAGGASGAGLTENVIDGYRFLGNNYEPGDEIYIFGFSRGAYTARSLGGLISLAGVVGPAHLGSDLKKIIGIYRDEKTDGDERKSRIAALNLGQCHDARIRCIGVWDTVGSLGIPGDIGRNLLPGAYHFNDTMLSPKVDVALHAIAIDEKRSAFSPTMWVRQKEASQPENQIVEQVWFSGVHSNIGGSYKDAGLSDIALDWMVKRVTKHTDLEIDQAYLERVCQPDIEGIGYESRTTLYLGSKAFPYQRLLNQTILDGSGFGEWFRRKFKKYDRRSIIPADTLTINEALHISALERRKCPAVAHDCSEGAVEKTRYRPVNLEAVVKARAMAVVDWQGERIEPEKVPWD
tara:strand:- start:56 stop:1273 length:1218 start_codon:yes stop_codon:yes gene_type:complete